jgi:hypothetical protein
MLEKGGARYESAAWHLLLFGKLLNRLCTEEKLYSYFSPEDVKEAAEKVVMLTEQIKKKYCSSGKGVTEDNPESQVLMLSIYRLAHAMTKSDQYSEFEEELQEHAKNLLEEKLAAMNRKGAVTKSEAASVFLTAYIYPSLLPKDEWKAWLDKLLDKMHHNFKTLRTKIQSNESSSKAALNIELFGLQSLAAIVLCRLDAEYYEDLLNKILRSTVKDALYKGIIGRPSSAYDHDVHPDKKAVFCNEHMVNNAFFLEMLRECA